jgi:uncharacterized protein (TIGR03000 family)
VGFCCLAFLGFVSVGAAQHGGGGHGGGGHGGGSHASSGGAHGSYGGHSAYSGHPGGGSYSGHGSYYGGHNGHGNDGHGHDGHFDHHHHGSFFAFYGFFGAWYPYTYWYGAPYRDWYDWDGGYYGAPVEPDGYYPPEPPQPTPARDPDKALVVVIVPDPDTQVSIDGEPTQQKGTERFFFSPALESGEKFHYTVRATWTDNGHENAKEMNVTVRAGYRTVVNFIAEPTSTKKTPEKSARK